MVVADVLQRVGDALDQVFLRDGGHGRVPAIARRRRGRSAVSAMRHRPRFGRPGRLNCTSRRTVGRLRRLVRRHRRLRRDHASQAACEQRCRGDLSMATHRVGIARNARLRAVARHFVAQANVSGMDAYERAVRRGRARLRRLLGAPGARARCSWHKPFTQRLDESQRAVLQVVRRRRAQRLVQLPRPQPRERQRATRPRSSSRPTTARSRRSPTRTCYARVCRFANALKARGIKKGDRVVIYMPMSIEGVVAMQACARIGATHSVVFGGFSAQSAAGAHHRRRRGGGDHRRRAGARRQGSCR